MELPPFILSLCETMTSLRPPCYTKQLTRNYTPCFLATWRFIPPLLNVMLVFSRSRAGCALLQRGSRSQRSTTRPIFSRGTHSAHLDVWGTAPLSVLAECFSLHVFHTVCWTLSLADVFHYWQADMYQWEMFGQQNIWKLLHCKLVYLTPLNLLSVRLSVRPAESPLGPKG